MKSLTWPQVVARRLARHHLLVRPAPRRVVEVVRDVAGIHAQVMAAAELSLCARVDGLTQQDVRNALWEERSLVKTWSVRGTLHLHPADELPLWMAARRAITGWRDGTWYEDDATPVLGVDMDLQRAQAVLDAIGEALDGRCLLREELADEVARRVGEWAREPLTSGWAFLIGPAVATGHLCHGPPQGNKITFVRADQWIGGWEDVDMNEALREVCRRYLRTYGPAQSNDFREWFTSRQFKPADARELFESLGDELEEVDVEGRRAYVLAGDTDFPEPQATVRLLPEYDVYVMGFREREHLVPEAVRERLFDHKRGRYEGPAGVRLIVVDGVAAGLWERKKRGKRIELQFDPVRKMTRAESERLEEEAARVGAFLGAEPVLSIL